MQADTGRSGLGEGLVEDLGEVLDGDGGVTAEGALTEGAGGDDGVGVLHAEVGEGVPGDGLALVKAEGEAAEEEFAEFTI